MKACLICPTPELDHYIKDKDQTHLLLSHLFNDRDYVKFYRDRSLDRGDYLIIDNGAKENTFGEGIGDLLEKCCTVKAKEIVLTDVRYDHGLTVLSGRAQIKWLLRNPIAYQEAGCPRVMIVPQGATLNDWCWCYERLMVEYSLAMTKMHDLRRPVIGIAYHYDYLFKNGIVPIIHHLKGHDELHLLGWPRDARTLNAVARTRLVRSVDSSRPFVYGAAGFSCLSGYDKYPGRGPDYFSKPLPSEHVGQIWSNINLYKTLALDL